MFCCDQRERGVGLVRLAAEPALEAADHDGQSGDPLADIVMEIPSDPRALGFLRRNQPPEQIGNLLVARLQHRLVLAHLPLGALDVGDLDARPDVTGKAAVLRHARNASLHHPAVLAIESSEAVLHVKRLAGIERLGVDVPAARRVFRMDALSPCVAGLLRESYARGSPASVD